MEFVPKSIRVISYATLAYSFDRGDIFKLSSVLLVFGSYYSYRYGVSVRILISGFCFTIWLERTYFECLLLCIFVYGCNHLFRVYVIENVMARYNRRSFSLTTADDFPLEVASTLDPAVFTGEGVNGNFKRPELDVGINMSNETKQYFLQDTNLAVL